MEKKQLGRWTDGYSMLQSQEDSGHENILKLWENLWPVHLFIQPDSPVPYQNNT